MNDTSKIEEYAAVPAELVTWPALEIARAVRERRLAPEAVIRAHLARIDEADPQLHAFQAVRRDGALADAAALAQRPDLGGLPLAGVPVAIKDNTDVAGLPTRQGSAATSAGPAASDDELVRRLRAAGAIPIGKTQQPELAVWPVTEPEAYPATRNPWDLSRTPGGSTGGGAAAVAAGMAALALGSDGGGSLRVPAACCGLVGVKPAPGRVPVAGRASEHWYGLTSFGPLARSAADAAVALAVLTGDADPAPVPPPAGPLRIAVSARHPMPGARTAPAVRAALAGVSELLRDAGHTMIGARPPFPATLGPRFSRRYLAGIAQDAAGLPASALEARTRAMASLGRRMARGIIAASADPFAGRAAAWLGHYDALLTPVLARPAVPIGTWAGQNWTRAVLGAGNWLFTTPWNLAGLPAASVPFGTDQGLPLAVQIIAPPGGERTVLALAAQIEQLRPWPLIAGRPLPGATG
jgi:amidase